MIESSIKDVDIVGLLDDDRREYEQKNNQSFSEEDR